jgi:hypothetical protein
MSSRLPEPRLLPAAPEPDDFALEPDLDFEVDFEADFDDELAFDFDAPDLLPLRDLAEPLPEEPRVDDDDFAIRHLLPAPDANAIPPTGEFCGIGGFDSLARPIVSGATLQANRPARLWL